MRAEVVDDRRRSSQHKKTKRDMTINKILEGEGG
jgi:hypothetical protein